MVAGEYKAVAGDAELDAIDRLSWRGQKILLVKRFIDPAGREAQW